MRFHLALCAHCSLSTPDDYKGSSPSWTRQAGLFECSVPVSGNISAAHCYISSSRSAKGSSSGKSPTSSMSGRTKPPYFSEHSKYRAPLTLPSFLPTGSSYLTPT